MKTYLLVIIFGFSSVACNKTLLISDVDYSQRIESVLQPDETGQVQDIRYGITFNVNPLMESEYNSDSEFSSYPEIRLIRGQKGYYYITASEFKHVYVFESKKEALKLKNKIKVSENGIAHPAFNSRSPFIQLIDTKQDSLYVINENGKVKGETS